MNILITGAFGFVGTNLSKVLKTISDNQLNAIDLSEPCNHEYDKFYSWHDCLNLDWNAVDIIIHLAGKAHDTTDTAFEKEYFDINVGLTQRIFQHFLNSSATKFIFFSSVKAVADSVQGDILTEAAIPNPQTPYGKSKLEAERLILEEWEKWKKDGGTEGRRDVEERLGDLETGGLGDCLAEQSHEEGEEKNCIDKKVYILRPCMIHGPGNKGNLNLLYKLQQKGIPWPLGAFENKRSFCSIENVSFVIQQLIEGNIEPGIYQIADDEAMSTNELINLMAISINRKTKIWHFPSQLIRAFARFGDILHLPLNSDRLKKLTESYVVSNAKIKQALSINQMLLPAQEGMKKTLDSFKNI